MGQEELGPIEDEDIGVGKQLRKNRPGLSRGILIGILLVLVLFFSFWIGFNLPRFFVKLKERMAVAVKPSLEVSTSEAPASPEAITVPLEVPKVKPEMARPVPRERVEKEVEEVKLYKVQAGVFEVKENALKLCEVLKEKGFPSFIKEEEGKYRVQVGAFKSIEKASELVETLKNLGFESLIFTEE